MKKLFIVAPLALCASVAMADDLQAKVTLLERGVLGPTRRAPQLLAFHFVQFGGVAIGEHFTIRVEIKLFLSEGRRSKRHPKAQRNRLELFFHRISSKVKNLMTCA